MEIIETVCFKCAHLDRYPKCEAFPDGIPQEVRDGLNDHKKPIEGDHGIQFEPLEL
jgi:hypothetical protein